MALDLMNKLTRANIPPPSNNPNPSIARGAILPLVIIAIKDMRRKIPAVIPNAKPIILQSTKIVNIENNKPTRME